MAEVVAYIKNTSDGHNKDYLVMKEGEEYRSAWGAIGGACLGTRRFNNKKHYENTVAKKVREGYYDALASMSSRDWDLAKSKVESLVKDFDENGAASVVAVNPTLNKKVSAAMSQSTAQVYSEKTVKLILKELRKYVEFNPSDNRFVRLAAEIGKCKNYSEVSKLFEEYDRDVRYLQSSDFMARVYVVLAKVKLGDSPIQDVLANLSKATVAGLKSDEQVMLRDMWKKKDFSLKQLAWLSAIFDKLEKITLGSARPIINPLKVENVAISNLAASENLEY